MNVNAPPRGARLNQAPGFQQGTPRQQPMKYMGVPKSSLMPPKAPMAGGVGGVRTPMGFKVTQQHNYLGHFKNPAILAQGHNPLTEKGEKIYRNMQREYGAKKGKSVFYASRNAGKIKGVD